MTVVEREKERKDIAGSKTLHALSKETNWPKEPSPWIREKKD